MIRLLTGDALDTLRTLDTHSVHCCVTSPPYWGLRTYLAADHPDKAKELGTEKALDCLGWATGVRCGACYICRLVAVFAEVRRVLRNDGTLWVVLGDSYAARGHAGGGYAQPHQFTAPRGWRPPPTGLQQKDICNVPWRFALAMQASGWIHRSTCVWYKPNVMPSSQQDRPTVDWEPVLLFAKQKKYYFDMEAVRQKTVSLDPAHPSYRPNSLAISQNGRKEYAGKQKSMRQYPPNGRSLRTVWTIATQPFKGAHYAIYPLTLAEQCLRASVSVKGCCGTCGAPWERIVDRYRTRNGERCETLGAWRNTDKAVPSSAQGDGHWRYATVSNTLGWQPSCACESAEPLPCTVLDPFSGAGTTAIMAQEMGLHAICIDLNPKDMVLAEDRLRAKWPLLAHINKEPLCPP